MSEKISIVSLFLEKQVDVVDSQRRELLVRTLQVEKETSERYKDGP